MKFKKGDQVQLQFVSTVEEIAADGECIFIRSIKGSHWVKAEELIVIDSKYPPVTVRGREFPVVFIDEMKIRPGQIWYWDFINAIILVIDKHSDKHVDLWHVQSNTPIHVLAQDFILGLTYVGEVVG